LSRLYHEPTVISWFKIKENCYWPAGFVDSDGFIQLYLDKPSANQIQKNISMTQNELDLVQKMGLQTFGDPRSNKL